MLRARSPPVLSASIKEPIQKGYKKDVIHFTTQKSLSIQNFFFFYFAEVGGGTEAYDGFERREVSADVKLGAPMANSDGVASRASN